MKNRFILNAGVGLIILLSTLNITISQAQADDEKKDHLGFSVSFGTKTNRIVSNHSAINNMKLAEEGGSVGLLWGNDLLEAKVNVGFYYSSARVPHTVDLVNLESTLQFYPLFALTGKTHKVQPYLSTGLAVNNYKLYGYYAGTEGEVNYSISIEPYLGNITTYFGSLGAGLEVNLIDQNDFVKLFTEINYYSPLQKTSSVLFNDSQVTRQLGINVGVSFGLNRFYK
jgi:hypothetical protein